MFAAIYFGQVPFAALPLVAVVPPPPPPPVVVEPEYCYEFAIGPCVGQSGRRTRVGRFGIASCVPSGRAVGQSGVAASSSRVGVEGGGCP